MWWWWIASWDDYEQLQGKNSLLRRGVLVLGGYVWVRFAQEEWRSRWVPDRCLLLWWLVLFIEAQVLFPNIERDGSQQRRANLKGAASTSYPDKSGLRLRKALGWRRLGLHDDLRLAVLLVLVSLHQYGNLCLMPRYSSPVLASLAPKRK